MNSYPLPMFYSIVKRFLNNTFTHEPTSSDIIKLDVSLPFQGYISYQVRDKLQSLCDQQFPQMFFRFVFTN